MSRGGVRCAESRCAATAPSDNTAMNDMNSRDRICLDFQSRSRDARPPPEGDGGVNPRRVRSNAPRAVGEHRVVERSYALGGGGSGAARCDVGALVGTLKAPAVSDGVCGSTMTTTANMVVAQDVIA